MTTNEFIKMLQEADPKGDTHLRFPDGMPFFAELKEGYWDGAYDYINEDGKWVCSIKNLKVDVHFKTRYDFIEEKIGRYPNLKTLDEIYEYFIFEFDGYTESSKNDKIKTYKELIQKDYYEIVNLEKYLYNDSIEEMKKRSLNGWKIYQPINSDFSYNNWLFLDENGNNQGSNYFRINPIVSTDLWLKIESTTMRGYYEYILK